MQLATAIDLLVLLAIVARIVAGFRSGLMAGILGLVGVIGGAAAGIWAGPRLVELVPALDATRLIRTITLIATVVLGSTIGDLIAGAIKDWIDGGRKPGVIDALLGGVTSGIAVAFVCWFSMAAVQPIAPAGLSTAITQSRSYQLLDEVMPDQLNQLPGQAVDLLVTELPRVFGGDEPTLPIPEPDNNALASPEVVAAAGSIVQVLSDAPSCRTDSSGSGWVVAEQRVVTNAHVVAGATTVMISVGGTEPALNAEVVAFDEDLDLAILAVPDLRAPPLERLVENQEPGTDTVAAGFPYGGPYQLSVSRIRGTVIESGSDIYGGPGIKREVYAIRGTVRPGNSGGPLLTTDGRVAGTVFAMSTVDAQTGYVLTDAATSAYLDQAASFDVPVASGACMVG
ncbi:MAG: MarP family serine protease [Propionibacterium sp.]|nr:MarP family serine protease [Propionibacterium sp.]